MCSTRGMWGVVFLCGIVLGGAAAVHAQDLQVSPTSGDFGNVPVGSSAMVTFDLVSGGPVAMWVYVASLHEVADDVPPYAYPNDYPSPSWSLGAFSFNPATWPALPAEVPAGDRVLIDVTFTPPSPGDYQAYLFLQSNDAYAPPGPHAFLSLQGTGVTAVVPAPGAALLGVIGLSAVRWLRRRKIL